MTQINRKEKLLNNLNKSAPLRFGKKDTILFFDSTISITQ